MVVCQKSIKQHFSLNLSSFWFCQQMFFKNKASQQKNNPEFSRRKQEFF